MRIPDAPEPAYDRSHHYHETSPFRARWITHPYAPAGNDFDAMFVARYERTVQIDQACTVRIHVSADERYELWLDGEPLGRGPERGDLLHWHFETYDLRFEPGCYTLAAVVHSMGRHRPYAQVSCRHALLVLAEGVLADQFSTGTSAWTARTIDAFSPTAVRLPKAFVAVGARFQIDGNRLIKAEPAVPAVDAGPVVLASMRMESPDRWQLTPAILPPMLNRPVPPGRVRRAEGGLDSHAWQAFIDGHALLTVPPHTSAAAIIDLQDYYCAYVSLQVDRGAGSRVAVEWAEALFEADGHTKRHRDVVDGMTFVGMGDTFLCPGLPVTFTPPWWSAGRYVRVAVTTTHEPLTLTALRLTETRYPFSWDGSVDVADEGIMSLLPLAKRATEACSHETFYDCPYYEQLMYSGDTRIEALVTYAFSRDTRLPRKAVRMFDESRSTDGLIQARCPSKITQVIPPFAIAWVGMVHDQMMWQDRPDETAIRVRGVRAVMDAAYGRVNADGLYEPSTGWNFVDWAGGWDGGVPPGGANRPTAAIHFQLAAAAAMAADLEAAVGEPELAQRHRRIHRRLVDAGHAAFFNPLRALFADDLDHRHFSEHAQVTAVLADAVPAEERSAFGQRFAAAEGLTAVSSYFAHYLFEAYRLLGRADCLFDRLTVWKTFAAAGFKTTPEKAGATRSDCHAWSAHPLFHLAATVLGVRPAGPHFRSVVIRPALGPLPAASGRVVHPRGMIEVDVERVGVRTNTRVRLPAGVRGVLIENGETNEI